MNLEAISQFFTAACTEENETKRPSFGPLTRGYLLPICSNLWDCFAMEIIPINLGDQGLSLGHGFFPQKKRRLIPTSCVRMASLLLQEAVARGLGPDDDLSQQLEHDPIVGKRQIFTTQPRQQKLRPAISEFGYFMYLALTVADAPSNFLDTMCPKGSKVVSRHVQRGFQRDVFLATKNAAVVNHIGEGEVFEVVKVGVPREPQQFITAAVELGHPRFLLARVSKDALSAVNGLLGDAADLSLQRSKFLKWLLRRANELRPQEVELHENLPVHLKKVLEGKRILLWKEVLEQLGYPDAKIMDEVVKGFPLTGWAEQSGVFMPDVRPPEMDVMQLYLTTVTKTLVPKTCPAFKKEAPKLKNNRDYANPQPSKHRCTVMFTATRKSRRNRSDITAERNESLTPQIFFADCFQTGNLRSAVLKRLGLGCEQGVT